MDDVKKEKPKYTPSEFNVELAQEIYPNLLNDHKDINDKSKEELLRIFDFYESKN